MESINVIVTTAIGDECLQQIASVSPKIQLTDASSLFRAEQGGDLAAREKLDILLAEAEAIYGFALPRNILRRAPKLKWIHVPSAGVNHLLNSGMVESVVTITNSSGVNAISVSEFALSLMLMFVKQAPRNFQLKQEKQWLFPSPSVFPRALALRSRTVGIVGLGSIGREVARLARAFGMMVLATRRSAKRGGRARYVDILLPPAQLGQLLAESDFVVLALPLTQETTRLIGEKELRAMKPTAYLINVARGDVVDEGALVRALDENWIAGAGLDVFATEPLPADSRLWELPNVSLSSHISGDVEDYITRVTELFSENLRRYLAGKRLMNVVDKKKGY